jgi:ribosomal-protein-alanine N-acetyltransferase
MKPVRALELLKLEGPDARWSLTDYECEIQNPDSRCFLIKDGATLAGFVLYRIFPDGWEIMNLAVRSRGQGWGRRLMHEFLASLSEKEGLEIRLEVSSQNQPAMALYEKCGFVEYGRRVHYYRDGTDAILMKRKI